MASYQRSNVTLALPGVSPLQPGQTPARAAANSAWLHGAPSQQASLFDGTPGAPAQVQTPRAPAPAGYSLALRVAATGGTPARRPGVGGCLKLSGRLADVCAQLDQMVANEARSSRA